MYGSKVYETPFTVKLNDFIASKYPGTQKSYSAFESQVTIDDKEQNNKFDARIFMNNILDYRGYRFFQASLDPDRKRNGTFRELMIRWAPGRRISATRFYILV